MDTQEVRNTHQLPDGSSKEDYHLTVNLDARFKETSLRKETRYRNYVLDTSGLRGLPERGLVTEPEATTSVAG